MIGPPADDDDDLPPAGVPFTDLLAWLAARLGRRPTLEDVAAVRWLQSRREKRRARRDERRRIEWEAAARRRRDDDEPVETPLRALLDSPEMAVFWAALPWLAGAMPLAAAARPYDEWLTRPETVLRLAESAERFAGQLPSAEFRARPRHEAEGVLAYVAWKLAEKPERLAPLESVGLAGALVAGVNVVTVAGAERIAADLAAATSDSDRRRILAKLRQSGETARGLWPGVDKLAGGPPLGLVPDPEPEPELEPVPPGGEDGPPSGPRPPGGGGGRK